MSEMQFHLDDFEGRPRLDLHISPAQGKMAEFLDGLEFQAAGDGLEVDLTVDRVDDTLHVHGGLEGVVEYTCGRCMRERVFQLDTELDFVLMPRSEWIDEYEDEEEIELDAEDLDISHYEGEVIDLEPLIREGILLELPSFPTCPEAEREACDEAYEAFIGEETVDEQEEAEIDLRWAPLKGLELEND